MSLEVHKIRLADGKPSCYYSAHLESPSVNDGFKVFLNPNTRLLISVHEVKDNKSHGFSVRWNIDNKPVSLSFLRKKHSCLYVCFGARKLGQRQIDD